MADLNPSPSPRESDLPFDAVILISFGGPEGPDDVMPFLENVTRGRNVPQARLLEVAEHYELFGGISPINAQNRALLVSLVAELNANGPRLPVYWGNRNWHPLLADSVQQMADDGIRRALAIVTSAFGSYSGCRQYLDDIEQARAKIGPTAPKIEKLRLFYNHPGFIEPMVERVRGALERLPIEGRDAAHLIFTAHSIPVSMAATSPYENQLREACRLVAEGVGRRDWQLAYQSRSGSPSQPWLGPDMQEVARGLAALDGSRDLVVVPIGFVSEHMEVVFDLDVELNETCEELGLNLVRSGVVGSHPRFVRMIRELITERIARAPERCALGSLGAWPDVCAADCCRAPTR